MTNLDASIPSPSVDNTQPDDTVDDKDKAKEWADKVQKREGTPDDYVFPSHVEDMAKLKQPIVPELAVGYQLYERQPFFYNKQKSFWVWDNAKYCYYQADETDMVIITIGQNLSILPIREQRNIIEALKIVGREHIPKEPPKTWIQFGKEIVDVVTGERHQATPTYFVTNPIPWTPADNEETPNIDRIFGDWVGKDKVKTLKQIAAYCALGAYPIHRIFFFLGSGRNGKSKFLGFIERFVGEHNIASSEIDLLVSSRFEMYGLYKKTACMCGEIDYTMLQNTARLKRLSGEDKIRYEQKGKDTFQEFNSAKILIATNSLPKTTDNTDGWYRRAMIIQFCNHFDEKKDILAEIPEQEYRAFAKQSLSLLKELLLNREFHHEGDIDHRKHEYEKHSDPLQRYISEYIDENVDDYIYKFEFKERFNIWQKANGYRVWNDTEIGHAMKQGRGIEEGKRAAELYGEGKRYAAWLNISYKNVGANTEKLVQKSIVSRVSRGVPLGSPRIAPTHTPLDTLDTLDIDLLRPSDGKVAVQGVQPHQPEKYKQYICSDIDNCKILFAKSNIQSYERLMTVCNIDFLEHNLASGALLKLPDGNYMLYNKDRLVP